jgi:signal transduction histidine kinase
MIPLLVAMTIGWIMMAGSGANWPLLAIGTTFLVLVLAGTVTYLLLSIKAININRRQSNFIDSVTHELKSPIASLKLYLQTLTRRKIDEQQQNDFYRVMLEDVERLDHLINHLLDAGRLDREPSEDGGDVEDIDLATLLVECSHEVCLRFRLPVETVRLSLEHCVVRARRVDLDMIFRNLIDNAIKYGGEQPAVEITERRVGDESVVVTTRDNGPGIPSHLQRKIFGRFVRLGPELERKQPGTGLGLYIVRTLVKRLRGRIRVSENANGTGTEFSVQLPTVGEPSRATPKTGSTSAVATKPADVRV